MDTIENLNIKKMKKIAHEIIDEDLKQAFSDEQGKTQKFEYKTHPITFVEYFNSFILNSNISLRKIYTPLIARGLCAYDGTIIIFLNHLKKTKEIDKKIFDLAFVCYHEARHIKQKKFNCYSYEGFLYEIDRFLRTNFYLDYLINHDKYSFEIGANLYGVKKAKKYLKENYPELYEQQKRKIENIEKKYQLNYMEYDAADRIDSVINLLKSKIKNNESIISSSNLDKIFIQNDLSRISPVLNMFLNEDGSFKTLSTIITKEPRFKALDKRIIYAFLSCDSFLKQLNIKETPPEELEIIREALQYTNTLYKKQKELLEKEKNHENISPINYLKSIKKLLTKITLINTINNEINTHEIKTSKRHL